ncbi:MAG: M48 family metalloprotease, partial [Lysobacteraceae bacterium]
HELGHIANNDMRRMTMARSFQNSLVWYLGWSRTVQGFGRWFLTWGSELLVLGLSRKREYWADAIGAALTCEGR